MDSQNTTALIWRKYYETARQQGRAGALLLLADEAPERAWEIEARRAAEHAAAQLQAPNTGWQPRQVFLFSGHMIDQPDRPQPRFPADKEPIAAAAIGKQLELLRASTDDLTICSGACGGDILFAESCLQRGLRLEVYLPLAIEEFLETSVNYAGAHWRERFFAIIQAPRTRLLVTPDELGPAPAGDDHFARTNLWMLYTAQAWGADKTRFICLWNGQAGDGPGGTKHLVDAVQQRAGQVYILNTTQLW
jgi:hypothetical protein